MSEFQPSPSMSFTEGVALHRKGNPREALECYLKALRAQPDSCDILLAIGAALHDLELYGEAMTVYQGILDRSAVSAALWHNRGNTLLALDRYQEAIDSYVQAVALCPGDVEAFVTMGTVLEQLGRYEQGLRCYEEALQRDFDCAEAHWNLALGLLRLGDYERGWTEFEWRWQKKGYTTKWRDFSAPHWQGEPLSGKSILIHAEQAFGDTIQFARYLPLVAALGARIVFECPMQLVTLFAANASLQNVIPVGAQLPNVDFHVHLLSLPRIFNTSLKNIPTNVPYVFAAPDRCQRWQVRLDTAADIKIGLVWAGRRRPDPHRSCALADFAQLAKLPGITWYSLQIGEGSEQAATPPAGMTLVDLTSEISDFADTAAIISSLDLIISIDTSVAHLAGAMGKPTSLLVPYAADLRWMLQRSDSPWYPTMRIFRQQMPGSWLEPVNEIVAAMKQRL